MALYPLYKLTPILICRVVTWKIPFKAPRLSSWMEENLPEGFTVFVLPYAMRQRLRTTNMLERLNREIKRRTRVSSLFPNEASLLRLVSAILMETSEEWETSKKYLTLEYYLLPN